jgi:hypothetical protein
MSSGYWSNLRPFEKRVVVGFGALFFIVLNFLFVIPHFSDLAAVHERMGDAQRKLARYQNEFAKTNDYAAGLRKFEGENSDVPAEEQSMQFANAVNIQAGQSGVQIPSRGHINTQTNQFFLEKTISLGVQAGEQQLVDFLYNLGSGNSQVRVRDLSVRPDPPGSAPATTRGSDNPRRQLSKEGHQPIGRSPWLGARHSHCNRDRSAPKRGCQGQPLTEPNFHHNL